MTELWSLSGRSSAHSRGTAGQTAPNQRCVGEQVAPSRPLDKAVDHLLLAGLVEGDGELVAVDLDDMAVAEFLVEHAVVEGKFRHRAGGFRDQLALDGQGRAFVAREAAEIA